MFKRAAYVFFSLMVVFGILMVNLSLIIIDTNLTPASYTANKRSVTIAESRGNIYDCNMKRLVSDEKQMCTVILPTTEAYETIKPFLSKSEADECADNVKSNKPTLLSSRLVFNNNQIKTIEYNKRYSDNQICPHLIGHLDFDGNGALGLEKAYNDFLKINTQPLKAFWSVDAMGRVLKGEEIVSNYSDYSNKWGIQLTIDRKIQESVEKILENNAIDKGCAVVLNGATSEILASASYPKFSPNNLEKSVNDNNKPFVNRAVSSYSIGSVFKPFTAALAIENGVSLKTYCNGTVNVGSVSFGCNNHTAHGMVDMSTAMEKSCNCYFIELGQKIGARQLVSFCKSLDFGEEREFADNMYWSKGTLPKAEEISAPQDLANFSFGQGKITTSPLHMACAYGIFLNKGFYRPPTLMKAIIDKNGVPIQKVKLPEKVKIISESTAAEMDKILESVVSNGNGKKAFSQKTTIHGKTATAQSGWYTDGREINHTWFCGYFTNGGESYIITVFKEDGESGAVSCAPIFKEIAEKIIENKNKKN